MEPLHSPTINQVVLIKRDNQDGDRIPMEYRMYISDKTYVYKAKIVKILDNKSYNRVQPLPLSADISTAKKITRKGYKSKTYKLSM